MLTMNVFIIKYQLLLSYEMNKPRENQGVYNSKLRTYCNENAYQALMYITLILN